MYTIEITQEADQDLVGLTMYSIEKYGEQQTKKYLEEFNTAKRSICQMPSRGHRRRDVPNNFLCYNFGEHVLIYTFNENAQSISIIRILHSRMNFSGRI